MSNVPTVCLTPDQANDINTDSFNELTKKMEDMAKKSEEDQEQIEYLKEQIVIAEEAAKIKNLPVEISDCGMLSNPCPTVLRTFNHTFLVCYVDGTSITPNGKILGIDLVNDLDEDVSDIVITSVISKKLAGGDSSSLGGLWTSAFNYTTDLRVVDTTASTGSQGNWLSKQTITSKF